MDLGTLTERELSLWVLRLYARGACCQEYQRGIFRGGIRMRIGHGAEGERVKTVFIFPLKAKKGPIFYDRPLGTACITAAIVTVI